MKDLTQVVCASRLASLLSGYAKDSLHSSTLSTRTTAGKAAQACHRHADSVPAAVRHKISSTYGKLPLSFEAN